MKKKLLLLLLIPILFIPIFGVGENFTATQQLVINPLERHFVGTYTLPNNQSIGQALQNLAASNPAAGSPADKLKNIITRVNATGGPLQVTINISVSNP